MKPNRQEMCARARDIEQDLDPLEPDNRAIHLMDDSLEALEMEKEEISYGEDRDVIGTTEDERRLANTDNVPEGMEGTTRGQDGNEVERSGEDLETGDGGSPHVHQKASLI